MCGEQWIQRGSKSNFRGSPPRVRGTERSHVFGTLIVGITPACAGNRLYFLSSKDWVQDHPRVCGEQSCFTHFTGSRPGSPPRVRGTGAPSRFLITVGRITPACAGNRVHGIHAAPMQEDHPRVCGEQPEDKPVETNKIGSPPRVRGTATGEYRSSPASGITPACAGNSGRGYL